MLSKRLFVCFQVKLVKLHPIPKHDPEAPQGGSQIYFYKWMRMLRMLLACRKFHVLGQVVFHMTPGTLKCPYSYSIVTFLPFLFFYKPTPRYLKPIISILAGVSNGNLPSHCDLVA